jgi:nicotinamidase-related amidase
VSDDAARSGSDDGTFDETRDLYNRAGIGGTAGFGSSPAVIVVDFQYGFTSTESPAGGDFSEVIERTVELLTVAREAGCPILFTTVAFPAGTENKLRWLDKMQSMRSFIAGSHWCDIDHRLQRRENEPILPKVASSGFFGTPLSAILTSFGVDTLIVVGCVTSGCVRATVVDGVSYGYRVIVPFECVGDRSAAPHDASLFDIESKYGDLMSVGDVCAAIKEVSARNDQGQPL